MPKDDYTRFRNGRLEVRVPYKCPLTNKWKSVVRVAANKTEARTIAAKLKAEYAHKAPHEFIGQQMTFADLSKAYTRPMPQPYRTLFEAEFGAALIQSITPERLMAFRQKRRQTPHRFTGSARTVATINREMQALNRYFVFAKKRGWLQVNPFDLDDRLIQVSEERPRTRLLKDEEFDRLLCHAIGDRAHLRPIILLAVDTGLRKSKILGLQWSQINFETGLITMGQPASRTKRHPPFVALTPRLRDALSEWRAHPDAPKGDAVFGQKDLKRSWRTLCRLAKVRDLHFHDLRHKYATNAILAGLPRDIVMKQTGHSTEVFDRYVNLDESIARQTAEALARVTTVSQKDVPDQE